MQQVQQIDRDAAYDYLKKQGRHVEAGMVAIGEHDGHAIVQLLAEYRVSVTADYKELAEHIAANGGSEYAEWANNLLT